VTPQEAVASLDNVMAHLWMVRTFLKHAEEIQEDADMLEVPRTIFDYVRSVEPGRERNDTKEYLHRARAKLSKLRRAAECFSAEHRRVSDHTNYQMAAVSLNACVRQIESILAGVTAAPASSTEPPTEN
jgi:hypothetical protein